MTIDELRELCQEAARDLATMHGRPLPAAVVLPLAGRTQVTTLPEFPDADDQRFDMLSQFAADRMVPQGAPAYGFIAEAELSDQRDALDVVVVVFGAHRRGSWVTAAELSDDQVGAFSQAEELDASALPFVQPLQHATDIAEPGSAGVDVLGLGS